MSPVAAHYLAKIHQIRKMDTNPARFQWMRALSGESDEILHARRSKWLRLAGLHVCHAVKAWDDLSQNVRDALSGVAA